MSFTMNDIVNNIMNDTVDDKKGYNIVNNNQFCA